MNDFSTSGVHKRVFTSENSRKSSSSLMFGKVMYQLIEGLKRLISFSPSVVNAFLLVKLFESFGSSISTDSSSTGSKFSSGSNA